MNCEEYFKDKAGNKICIGNKMDVETFLYKNSLQLKSNMNIDSNLTYLTEVVDSSIVFDKSLMVNIILKKVAIKWILNEQIIFISHVETTDEKWLAQKNILNKFYRCNLDKSTLYFGRIIIKNGNSKISYEKAILVYFYTLSNR